MKSKTYEEFVEKFKPKKTTDDCYTPPAVYDAIAGYVCRRYGVDPTDIVRPFWPGADYEAMEYPAGCVVVDNPPFSIVSKICRFYLDRKQAFFLFAPSLTALAGASVCMKMNHLIVAEHIKYENGATVPTAFVTNMGDDGNVLEAAPELSELIREAKQSGKNKKTLPKYDFPEQICTAAMCQMYARHGIKFAVKKNECVRISALDSMRKQKKQIFGGGLLLDTAATEKNARAANACKRKKEGIQWPLSELEKEIIKQMDKEAERRERE